MTSACKSSINIELEFYICNDLTTTADKLKCLPDPKNVHGECLTCQRIRTSRRSFQLPCQRYRLRGSPLSWVAKDPPVNVLTLAQDSHFFDRYIAESSIDFVKKFIIAKDSITKAVFSLACGQWSPVTVGSPFILLH